MVRRTTLLFALFESKGEPSRNKIVGPLSPMEILIELAEWIAKTPMNRYMVASFATKREQLLSQTGSGPDDVAQAEFLEDAFAAIMEQYESEESDT
jgi:hypothetical protein